MTYVRPTALAAFVITLAAPLFAQNQGIGGLQATPSDARPLEEVALERVRALAISAPERLGITGDGAEAVSRLTIVEDAFRNRGIGMVKFRQTYRGLPIHGDEANVVVVLRDEDIAHVYGKVVDPEVTLSGLEQPISEARARRAVEIRWQEARRRPDARIDTLELVALPSEGRMAWRARMVAPAFASSLSREGTVLVDALSGALVALEDLPAEARAIAPSIGDDPESMTLFLHSDLPAVTTDNTLDFSDPDAITCNPIGWRKIRLGTRDRHAVMSLEGTSGSALEHYTAARCLSGSPEEIFAGGPLGAVDSLSEEVYAQDVFIKMRRAMAFIDPLMGEMVSHGGTHPYSWDHDPGVPEIMHRAPVVNALNGAPSWFVQQVGVFRQIAMSEADAEALGVPIAHPLTVHCRDASGATASCGSADAVSGPLVEMSFVSVRASTPFQTRTLFHEIGHYYDMFNAYGISGDNGEIIPQMIALYLMKRMYDIDYQITSAPLITCELGRLISHSAGRVVHPDCITDVDQIAREIDFEGPYTVPAFTQALWSLLNGVSCELSGAQLLCSQIGGMGDDYPDRWMEALLFAMQMGNDLGQVELWDAMAMFIEANYPQDANRMQVVRTLHGLL